MKFFLKILVAAKAMFMHPETSPRLLSENSGYGTSDMLVLVVWLNLRNTIQALAYYRRIRGLWPYTSTPFSPKSPAFPVRYRNFGRRSHVVQFLGRLWYLSFFGNQPEHFEYFDSGKARQFRVFKRVVFSTFRHKFFSQFIIGQTYHQCVAIQNCKSNCFWLLAMDTILLDQGHSSWINDMCHSLHCQNVVVLYTIVIQRTEQRQYQTRSFHSLHCQIAVVVYPIVIQRTEQRKYQTRSCHSLHCQTAVVVYTIVIQCTEQRQYQTRSCHSLHCQTEAFDCEVSSSVPEGVMWH